MADVLWRAVMPGVFKGTRVADLNVVKEEDLSMGETVTERLRRLSAAATQGPCGLRDMVKLIDATMDALPLLLELEAMVGRHVEVKRKRHSLAELAAMAEDGRTDDWSIALSYEAMEAVWQQLQEEGDGQAN